MTTQHKQKPLIEILKTLNSVNDLKSFSSFNVFKNNLKQLLGLEVKATGWQDLYEKIILLKNNIFLHEAELKALLHHKDLTQQHPQLVKWLGFSVIQNQHINLQFNLKNWLLLTNSLSASEKYELSKRHNFMHSSRLEGINLPMQQKMDLEDVLSQYRATP